MGLAYESDSATGPGNGHSVTMLKVADTIAKLLAAGAIVFAAIIANTYQSKITAVTLLAEREQAESELRATMFSDLIGPITGPYSDGAEIAADRERLLVELLALNFHEHFELKPLLLHVDQRLKNDRSSEHLEEARGSLRSVARRVINRQIAALFKESCAEDGTKIVPLTFTERALDAEQTARSAQESESDKSQLQENGEGLPCEEDDGRIWRIGECVELTSPDEVWTLKIRVLEADWENLTFRVVITNLTNSTHMDFTLTQYDFPLTDNTLLSDGNRYALVIDSIRRDEEPKIRSVALRLIWFPRNYFTARERPIDYREFRNKLGIGVKKTYEGAGCSNKRFR